MPTLGQVMCKAKIFESCQAAPFPGRHLLEVINMKNSKVSALTSDYFQHLMEQASAGFELDCKQACRGLRVSMAVKVFGMGTLLPNNFADEDTVSKPTGRFASM